MVCSSLQCVFERVFSLSSVPDDVADAVSRLLAVVNNLQAVFFGESQAQELLAALSVVGWTVAGTERNGLLSACVSAIEVALKDARGATKQLPVNVVSFFMEIAARSGNFSFFSSWAKRLMADTDVASASSGATFRPLLQAGITEDLAIKACSAVLHAVVDGLRQAQLAASAAKQEFVMGSDFADFVAHCAEKRAAIDDISPPALEIGAHVLKYNTISASRLLISHHLIDSLCANPHHVPFKGPDAMPASTLLFAVARAFSDANTSTESRMAALAFFQSFVQSLRKITNSALSERLLALSHFVAAHSNGTEFPMALRCYEKMLSKLKDSPDSALCLAFIRNDLLSQEVRRVRSAGFFFEGLVKHRSSVKFGPAVHELFSLISGFAVSASSADVPAAVRTLRRSGGLLAEKHKGSPWLITLALEVASGLLKRDDIGAEAFVELVQLVQMVAQSASNDAIPATLSAVQGLLRKGATQRRLEIAVECCESMSRLLEVLSRHPGKKWSSAFCHHLLQECVAQIEHAPPLDASSIEEALRPGIFALLSICDDWQCVFLPSPPKKVNPHIHTPHRAKRIHYQASSKAKEIFKGLRALQQREETKFKGKI